MPDVAGTCHASCGRFAAGSNRCAFASTSTVPRDPKQFADFLRASSATAVAAAWERGVP
jgi:hypothetical protein